MPTPAGWFPAPEDPAQLRYWNGSEWTTEYAPNPYAIVAEPPAAKATTARRTASAAATSAKKLAGSAAGRAKNASATATAAASTAAGRAKSVAASAASSRKKAAADAEPAAPATSGSAPATSGSAPAEPGSVLSQPMSVASVTTLLRSLPLASWIGIALVVLFGAVALASSGLRGLVVLAAVIAVVTAVYVVVTGRTSWLRVPDRKRGLVILAGALVALVIAPVLPMTERVDDDALASSSRFASTPTTAPPTSSAPAPTPTPTATVDLDPTTPVVGGTITVAASAPTAESRAVDLLATLAVKGRAPKTGYDRVAKFGSAWMDVDRNGCDTRNDILKRDLTAAVLSGTCKIASGTLADPYTGKNIAFTRGETTSAMVQIDHVVALSDAWQKGAQQLSQDQRLSLANDPLNLMAIDGPTNAQKSDGDAATWLPSAKSFRCTYVSRQIAVKATYALWVTQAEHDAMAKILADCPDQMASYSAFTPVPLPPAPAPEPAPVVEPAPFIEPEPVQEAPAPEPAPQTAYYANCDAVRAAGAAPIRPGDPGFQKKFDRDGDGVGCE